MTTITRTARAAIAALALASVGACSQAGTLGNVLGSVLGGQQGNQVSGTVRQIDTRNQQLAVQQSNGQTVALQYDNQTKVVYQNQQFSVSNLEYGDQVTARIQQTQNGSYYTDLVQVDQSVQSSTSTSNTQVQSLQGVVRRVDTANGWFQIDGGNNVLLTVYMPYNPSRADLQRFQSLRNGDVARFTGVYVNSNRVDLQQFY